MEMLHGGRPRNEEPHVKKSMKKHGEKVDLILRVDLVSTFLNHLILDVLKSLCKKIVLFSYFRMNLEFLKMSLMTCRVCFR